MSNQSRKLYWKTFNLIEIKNSMEEDINVIRVPILEGVSLRNKRI